MIDAFHQWLLLQEGEDAIGVLLMGAQSGGQSAQAAQGEVGVECPGGKPQTVGPPHQRLGQCGLLGNRHSAHHVGVTVDVFGGGVHHHVGTEGQRLLQQRGEEGVVHHHLCTCLVGGAGNGADIHHPQQRVGGGLDPYQRRLLGQRGGQCGFIPLIDKLHPVVALGCQILEQAPGAAVAVVRGDQQIPRFEQGGGDQMDCPHAGAGDHGTGAPFQCRQRVRQIGTGRIAGAGIIVLTGLAKVGKCVVAGEVDGGHHGTVLLVCLNPGAYRQGGLVGHITLLDVSSHAGILLPRAIPPLRAHGQPHYASLKKPSTLPDV